MAIIVMGARSPISNSGFGAPDPPFDEDELRRGAMGVGDGMRFLRWLSSHLYQEDRSAAGIRRAMRECWAMHASRLLSFYYGPRRVSRALLAEDYVSNPEVWYRVRTTRPTGLEMGQRDIPRVESLVAYRPDGSDEAVLPRARRILEVSTGLIQLSATFLGLLGEARLQWFAPSAEGDRPWWRDELDGEEGGPGER